MRKAVAIRLATGRRICIVGPKRNMGHTVQNMLVSASNRTSSASRPTEIVIDCPVPPSANRLWRVGRGRVYKSQKYQRWMWTFRYYATASARKIKGEFDIEILIHPIRKRDA